MFKKDGDGAGEDVYLTFFSIKIIRGRIQLTLDWSPMAVVMGKESSLGGLMPAVHIDAGT
ncbi:hypothetical protein [Desulfomarina sp.]